MGVPISNVTRRVVYTASGTGPYAFTFEILANTDIAVYKDDALLTLTTDYTVTIASNGTGSITLVAAPTGADQIAIVGNRAIKRTTDFVTGGDFFANTVNDEMDQQTIFAQQNAEGLLRALSAPQTDPTSVNMTLPRASVRANKNLAFDANGDPVVGEAIGDFRGNWASGTAYNKRDLIKDTSNGNIYYCVTAHTASGSQPISTNTDSAKWTLIVDAATATAAQVAAEAAQAAAETAETNAETAETNAETAETNAETAATNAASSASAASTSATSAASSASSASTSASTATTKASEASTSATNAASSASSASTSASTATTKASEASTSASNASTSATNAANSASSASSSASTATTQATNAASSASAASTSATNASNSASAAATSETNAAASAAAAATFDPAMYLSKAGNLSGLANTATARDNLGVEIGVDVQAFNAALAAIAANNGTNMMKNRIINGAMTIDQRNAGASVTPTTYQYLVDRWQYGPSQASKFSLQQNAGAVTPPASFINYLGATSLSAYSVTSTDLFLLTQYVEGLNVADFGWGTANAATVTLSFWVRSSLTGAFGGSLKNGANNRSYPFSYTISAANTWEQKTITVAGDTSGTWLTTNGRGLILNFGMGVGSTYSGPAGAWAGADYLAPTGATSVVGTSGATFYITGVQLEKGSTATSFDYRPYGTELALCQRYYQTSYSGVAVGTVSTVNRLYSTLEGNCNYAAIAGLFPVTMRATPTMAVYNPYTGTVSSMRADAANVAAVATGIGPSSYAIGVSNVALGVNVLFSGHFTASAEL